MKIRAEHFLLVLSCLILFLPAASKAEKNLESSKELPAELAKMMLQEYDLNNDEKLAKNEVDKSKLAPKFTEADKNEDGTLNKTELEKLFEKKLQEKKLLSNSNETENHLQIANLVPETKEAANKRNLYERLSIKVLEKNDLNKDGKLSKEEIYDAKPYLAKKFSQYDLNKDNYLDKIEIANYYQTFLDTLKKAKVTTKNSF
jgi:Ca2+-binding EF-hand superfamily protein